MPNEIQTEFGVDAERELAANAGVADALANDDCDDRFGFDFLRDMFMRIESDNIEPLLSRAQGYTPMGIDRSGSMASEIDALVREAYDIVIVVGEDASGRGYVNRLIDADLTALIGRPRFVVVDQFADDPKDLPIWGRPPETKSDRLVVVNDDPARFLADPFLNAVMGKEEPNDQRNGFYRDFEGKRLDGSYKRAKKRGKGR